MDGPTDSGPSSTSTAKTEVMVDSAGGQGEGGAGRDLGVSDATRGESAQAERHAAQAADKTIGEATETADTKLSAKEMKLKKQAEKQARRALEKAARGGDGSVPSAISSSPSVQPKGKHTSDGPAARTAPAQTAQLQTQAQAHKSINQAQRPVATPPRQSTPKDVPSSSSPTRELGLFGHLSGSQRRTSLEGVSKEVHPAVLSLGFQTSNYTICGSSARCVAMLLAFKAAIASYTTPPTTSLARHLTSHYLSPQIEYLKSHRPISVSMGNAIRWLKDYIIHIDPDTPEPVAKADIAEAIDTFIRERITLADQAIADSAKIKIRPGCRVVTYGKSSIVEQTLLAAVRDQRIGMQTAHRDDDGQRQQREQEQEQLQQPFAVTVLDSRPLFEGRNLARRLVAAGVEVTYALLPAASHVLPGADLVLLGAHAMMANGRLYSRVGTACVAMLAKAADVPVIVLAESIKFTDRVALDSILLNEVAPSMELVLPLRPMEGSLGLSSAAGDGAGGSGAKGNGKKGVAALGAKEDTGLLVVPEGKVDAGEGGGGGGGVGGDLIGWQGKKGLQLLNILYDVTPAEYIDVVITEYGSLPPSSVPVVYRISSEKDVRGG